MNLRQLPPPTTFAEGQRQLFGCLVALAGLAIGAGAVAIVAVLVWGNWPATLFGKIVELLGFALIGALAIMATVIVGLLVGGPVGRFSGRIGKDGVELEAEHQESSK